MPIDTKRAVKLALLLSCFTLHTGSHAGRPLATEDADVLGRGECEWESFGARTTAHGTPAIRALSTQVGCGVDGRSQVALSHARAKSEADVERTWAVSGKTRLIAREANAPGLTLAWGTAWHSPPGERLSHDSVSLALVATQALQEGWLAHANLGWAHSRQARQDTTTWNLAVEKSLRQGLDVMGEVYGDDRQRPWVGGGIRWSFSDTLSWNAAYAVQTASPQVKLLSVGFKWVF